MLKFLTTALNLLPLGLRKRLFVGLGLVRRSMTLGVRILVKDSNNRVLLVRHTYVPGWYLPGGGVERGETMPQAAIKELREECAIKAQSPPDLFHIYRNPRTSRFDHVALFICNDWQQVEEKLADYEIAETGFFDLDDLPDGTTVPTRNRLSEVFGDRDVSDIW